MKSQISNISIIIVVIDYRTNEGFWTDFDNSRVIDNVVRIPLTKESQFNFTTFNTIVIDYFVNGKKRLFLVEGFLKLEENQELKGFLQVLFKVFDISLPFVLKYEYLDELIDASGFTLQVSDKSILELSKEITFNGSGRIKGTHFYYQAHFLDDENIIVCSPMMLVHLGERYFHVQKFCS